MTVETGRGAKATSRVAIGFMALAGCLLIASVATGQLEAPSQSVLTATVSPD